MALALMTERSETPVATGAELAVTRKARRRGLLGRDGLAPGSALVLSPCGAIHTAFMRFAIDVVFLDRQGRAVRLVHEMPPWRIAMSARARAVVELPAGRLRACGIEAGDRLFLAPVLEQQRAGVPAFLVAPAEMSRS